MNQGTLDAIGLYRTTHSGSVLAGELRLRDGKVDLLIKDERIGGFSKGSSKTELVPTLSVVVSELRRAVPSWLLYWRLFKRPTGTLGMKSSRWSSIVNAKVFPQQHAEPLRLASLRATESLTAH